MASVPKSTLTSFVQDWNGRKSWAQSAGIPYSDFAATVKYDYNRMSTSQNYVTKMSDTEAFDAMSSLKSGHNPFTTPADSTPSFFSNPFGAIRNDVQGIVTGLFHAPQAIAHDLDSAAHGHFGALASFIPGYTDVTDLFSSSGRQFLAEHPVSDLLDVGGIGKIADLGEAALRNVGATGAADVLSKMPDHPASMLLMKTFNAAADNVTALGSLREHGTSILGHAGQLEFTKNNYIRPISVSTDIIHNTPAPLYHTAFNDDNINFGRLPQGKGVIQHMHDIQKGVSEDDVNTAIDAAVNGRYKGQGIGDPRKFLNNPDVSKDAKNLFRSFKDMSASLTWGKELADLIQPVFHKDDPKNMGFVPVGDNRFSSFVKQYTKQQLNAAKAQTDIGEAIQTIQKTRYQLTFGDAKIPDELKLQPNEQVAMPAAIRRAADYYKLNAGRLFQGDLTDAAGKRRYTTFRNAITRLFGPDSTAEHIMHGLPSLTDKDRAAPILNDIQRIRKSLNGFNIVHDNVFNWLNSALDQMQNNIIEMTDRQAKIGQLKKLYDSTSSRMKKMDKSYELMWNKHTQGRFASLVQEKQIELVKKYFQEHYVYGEQIERRLKDGTFQIISPETGQSAFEQIEAGNYSHPDVQAIITRPDWIAMQNEAWMSINDMKTAGYDPMFYSAVQPEEARRMMEPGYQGGLGDASHFVHLSAEKERTGILTSSIYDPRLAIPKESIGLVRQKVINKLISEFFQKGTLTDQQMIAESRYFFTNKVPNPLVSTAPKEVAEYAHAHGWVPWDPNNPLGDKLVSKHLTPIPNENRLWIKDYNLKIMQRSVKQLDADVNKMWDTGMQIYRGSVLYLSPRFGAHVTLGGTFMTMLRLEHPISSLKYLGEAWRIAGDEKNLPAFISRGVAEQGEKGELVRNPLARRNYMKAQIDKNPTGAHLFLVGRKLAQLFQESMVKRTGQKVGAGLTAYKNILEHVANTQRVLALLDKKAHIKPGEITPEVLAEAKRWNTTPEEWLGAVAARKVLADMQVVSPMERAILMRYVMPFWGWTRHVLRYVATYPVDHPLRASIIQSISNQALGDDSNLPDYLFRLLFLGQPNAQGNVTVLDDRQWNPLRDVANYMTWGGIMSNLNPVLQAITSSAWGVDSATGGPDLFPQLTFDSFYGSESAAPSGGNVFVDLAKQISPQLNTLLQVAKKTSSLRQEAASHPGTLPYLIGDAVGVPWIPYTLNTKNIQIKKTVDEHGLASSAVQSALTQNSMAPLKGYNGLLPLSGYEVDKNYIADLIQSALQYNKSHGLPETTPALETEALPYASPYSPQVVLGNPQEGQGSP